MHLETFKNNSCLVDFSWFILYKKLQKMRRKYELQRRVEDRKFENERWIDEKRKAIIGNRLRKNLDDRVERTGRMYDPSEGFSIHWDYVLGLPKRTAFAQ